MKLVSIEREGSFCYAAVSRGGRVGVCGADLRLLAAYEVSLYEVRLREILYLSCEYSENVSI